MKNINNNDGMRLQKKQKQTLFKVSGSFLAVFIYFFENYYVPSNEYIGLLQTDSRVIRND